MSGLVSAVIGAAVLAELVWIVWGRARLRLRRRLPAVTGDPALAEVLRRTRGRMTRRLALISCDASGDVRIACAGCDASTPFEVGSLTKAALGLALAACEDAGRVSADATLGDLDPTVPEALRAITVAELATHTSGLPRLACTFGMVVRGLAYATVLSDPYRGLGAAAVRRDAARAARRRERRRGRRVYSNLGAALLGQTLAAGLGVSFGELLDEWVLTPLGMDATTLARPRGMARGLCGGRPAALWRADGYAPAGGLCSTPRDIGRLLHGLGTGTAPGMAALGDGRAPGLFWQGGRGARPVAWHNGQTGGYGAWLRVSLDEPRRATAVLGDVADSTTMGRIARAADEAWSPAPERG